MNSLIYRIPNTVVFKAGFFDVGEIYKLSEDLEWQKIYDDNRLVRSTCWYTREGCSCNYKYGGNVFLANDLPYWLKHLWEEEERV